METVINLVTSKLWVLGTSLVSVGNRYWSFFYSIEGVDTKVYYVIFYNHDLNRMYIRSPVIDLKVDNVILQKCKYVSNVYKLLIEWKKVDKLYLWDPKDTTIVHQQQQPALLKLLKAGIISQSCNETYFCAPPILLRGSFYPLKVENTQHTIVFQDFNGTTTTTSGGYVTYRANPKASHAKHYNKTWIPQVTVDSTTFECSFEIVYNTPRSPGECLECVVAARGEYFSPTMSNLLINH